MTNTNIDLLNSELSEVVGVLGDALFDQISDERRVKAYVAAQRAWNRVAAIQEEVSAVKRGLDYPGDAIDDPYDALHIGALLKEWFAPHPHIDPILISGLGIVLGHRMKRLASVARKEREREHGPDRDPPGFEAGFAENH